MATSYTHNTRISVDPGVQRCSCASNNVIVGAVHLVCTPKNYDSPFTLAHSGEPFALQVVKVVSFRPAAE